MEGPRGQDRPLELIGRPNIRRTMSYDQIFIPGSEDFAPSKQKTFSPENSFFSSLSSALKRALLLSRFSSSPPKMRILMALLLFVLLLFSLAFSFQLATRLPANFVHGCFFLFDFIPFWILLSIQFLINSCFQFSSQFLLPWADFPSPGLPSFPNTAFVGHQKNDADSICSAIAAAHLFDGSTFPTILLQTLLTFQFASLFPFSRFSLVKENLLALMTSIEKLNTFWITLS